MPEERSKDEVRVNIPLGVDLHTELKGVAVRERVTLQALIERALQEWLQTRRERA